MVWELGVGDRPRLPDLALGGGLPGPAAPDACAAERATVTVVWVFDGGTVAVETAQGVRIHVHLLGIESPRLRAVRSRGGRGAVGEPFAAEAKKALEELVHRRQVEVEFYGRDLLRRVQGVLHLGGENVNVHMVRGGLARVHRGGVRVPEEFQEALEQAEAEAKGARRGVWMFE